MRKLSPLGVLSRLPQPLPLAGCTLRPERRRSHEATIERQDASAIHRITPRRSCEDDCDGARTREQAHSARLRGVPRLEHDRLDDPPVSIPRHLQQAADHLRRALVAEELLLALPDGRVLGFESKFGEGMQPGTVEYERQKRQRRAQIPLARSKTSDARAGATAYSSFTTASCRRASASWTSSTRCECWITGCSMGHFNGKRTGKPDHGACSSCA
jgi:hypothetical protein